MNAYAESPFFDMHTTRFHYHENIKCADICRHASQRCCHARRKQGRSQLNILKEIGDRYLAGATVDELLEWAKAEVNKFAIYFFVDDLTFLKRSGWVSNIAGTMGTLLGIRPIIHVNEEGNMVSIGKEKGRRNAVDRLIRYVEEIGDNATQHRFIITHTDAPELAEELKEILKQRIGENIRLEITNVSPTIGCHCGPDSAALSFHVKHR